MRGPLTHLAPRGARLLAVALSVGVVTGCAGKVQLPLDVEVLSNPEQAAVTFRGEARGTAPTAIRVQDFDDVHDITAQLGDLGIVEKRLRFVTPDQAELIFRFASEPTPMAQALGVARLFVFEYAENVSFDTGLAELKPDSLPILEKQAEIIRRYFPDARLYVLGHTDSTGSAELNLDLSARRAQVVYDFLVAHQVPVAHMEVRGFGEDFPIADNDTLEGRAVNRRTEVALPE